MCRRRWMWIRSSSCRTTRGSEIFRHCPKRRERLVPAARLDGFAAVGAELGAESGFLHKAFDRGAQFIEIKPARDEPGLAVVNQLAGAPLVGNNHGQTARLRLHDYVSVGVGHTGEKEC